MTYDPFAEARDDRRPHESYEQSLRRIQLRDLAAQVKADAEQEAIRDLMGETAATERSMRALAEENHRDYAPPNGYGAGTLPPLEVTADDVKNPYARDLRALRAKEGQS